MDIYLLWTETAWDTADVITGSEHISKTYANKHSLTATAIKDLIKDVFKNPEFNASEIDTDMLQRHNIITYIVYGIVYNIGSVYNIGLYTILY